MKRKHTLKKGGRRWRHAKEMGGGGGAPLAPYKKKGAPSAQSPTHYLSKPAGGGLGVSHTRSGPGRPPLDCSQQPENMPKLSELEAGPLSNSKCAPNAKLGALEGVCKMFNVTIDEVSDYI